VTHDQEEAFSLGEIVAIMFDGVIVQQGRPAELYEAPADRRVAEFVGDANFFPGQGAGASAETFLGRILLREPVDGELEVMVRPEEILVGEGDEGIVEGVEFYGHDSVYDIRLGSGRWVRARVLATPRFRAGDGVALSYSGRPTVAFQRA